MYEVPVRIAVGAPGRDEGRPRGQAEPGERRVGWRRRAVLGEVAPQRQQDVRYLGFGGEL